MWRVMKNFKIILFSGLLIALGFKNEILPMARAAAGLGEVVAPKLEPVFQRAGQRLGNYYSNVVAPAAQTAGTRAGSFVSNTAKPYVQNTISPAFRSGYSTAQAQLGAFGGQLRSGAQSARDRTSLFVQNRAVPYVENTALPAMRRGYDATKLGARQFGQNTKTFMNETVAPEMRTLTQDIIAPAARQAAKGARSGYANLRQSVQSNPYWQSGKQKVTDFAKEAFGPENVFKETVMPYLSRQGTRLVKEKAMPFVKDTVMPMVRSGYQSTKNFLDPYVSKGVSQVRGFVDKNISPTVSKYKNAALKRLGLDKPVVTAREHISAKIGQSRGVKFLEKIGLKKPLAPEAELAAKEMVSRELSTLNVLKADLKNKVISNKAFKFAVTGILARVTLPLRRLGYSIIGMGTVSNTYNQSKKIKRLEAIYSSRDQLSILGAAAKLVK